MALDAAHRSSIYTKLVPILGEDDANTLMSEFPSVEAQELVTKEFLRAELLSLKDDLRDEFATKRDLLGECASVRSDLRGEIATLGSELRGEMADLASDLQAEMSELRADMARLGDSADRSDRRGLRCIDRNPGDAEPRRLTARSPVSPGSSALPW